MATTETLKLEQLTPTVGAEVLDVDRERLLGDEDLPRAVMDALEEHGVLVFRELNVDDHTQAAFCHRLGKVRLFPDHPIPEIYEVSYNPSNPYAKYVESTVNWHIDGLIEKGQEIPVKATVLTAKVLADKGGDTEFASTYAGYDALSDADKERYLRLRVMHTFVAPRRLLYANPTPEQLADWESRGGREHPLVWTHESGRRSLVIGSSADHVVGMKPDESRALLDEILARATTPDRVLRHRWSVGDTVIWDNGGLLHRAQPYDRDSGREMHRTTILGTERVQ
jgi:alpha-ketoglutarate-dependent taurine dioxygenase